MVFCRQVASEKCLEQGSYVSGRTDPASLGPSLFPFLFPSLFSPFAFFFHSSPLCRDVAPTEVHLEGLGNAGELRQ